MILSLDLGTTTGWALDKAGHITSGSKKFSSGKKVSNGRKFLEFYNWLVLMFESNKVEVVYYEHVRRHLGTCAAHAYGGFLAILTALCELYSISYTGIPVGSIKKFATGSGNASKDAVIQAIQAKGFMPQDDNEADALAILILAQNLQKVDS